MRSQKVLQKATWSKYLTRTENLKEALFSRERTIKSQELDALRVEIWIEGLEYDDDEPSTDETSSILTDHSLYPISPSSSSTGNSGFPKKRRRRGRRVVKKMEPPKRRIVVYCRDRIITVRFAKACRFPPSYHEPGKGIPKSGILKLGLTNNAMCFEINQIFPDEESGHTYAGIPLCWNALAAEEEKGAERVTSLSLTFMNESDAEDFYKEYFEEKNLWLAEVKAKDNGHLQ
ncbi:hypothetical protein BDD12DRAFT_343493 [Trichophaea hybrida]|nr:hypothetical protein BDD12DRAFT_343493 [Trichophaea hybrida]